MHISTLKKRNKKFVINFTNAFLTIKFARCLKSTTIWTMCSFSIFQADLKSIRNLMMALMRLNTESLTEHAFVYLIGN